jgi:hypothetical protein
MGTRYNDTESQENIIGPYEMRRVQSRTDGILKTDEVTITYGVEEIVHRSKDHPANWRPQS